MPPRVSFFFISSLKIPSSLRLYLCAIDSRRQTRNKQLAFYRGLSLSLFTCALSRSGSILLEFTSTSPTLCCAPSPLGGWPYLCGSMSNTEIFAHSSIFPFLGWRGMLKDKQALLTSAWILQCNIIILIHFENCQIHDEMNHDVASSSENFPFGFKDCLL